jgi:hypothetical protein
MRHIGTLIAALIIAPLAWILIAFGQDRSAQAFDHAEAGAVRTGDFVRPLLFLLAAGILLGLIATLRFSPLGAVVAGALYTASYLLLLVAPNTVLDATGYQFTMAGRQADLSMPLRTGTSLLVGAALLLSMASVKRWRRWPRPDEDTALATSDDSTWLAPARERPFGLDSPDLRGDRTDSEPAFASSAARSGRPAPGGPDAQWVAALRGGRDTARW